MNPDEVDAVERRLLALGGPPPGAGSPTPRLCVVAERDKPGVTPLCSYRTGGWLWGALRMLGWRSEDCYVLNAFTADGRPYDVPAVLADLGDPLALVLGKPAREALRNDLPRAVFAPHPQWHRRFKVKEGVEGFARRLEAAGLPRGDGLRKARELFVERGYAPAAAAEEAGVPLRDVADALVREDWVAAQRSYEEARRVNDDEGRRERLVSASLRGAISVLAMLGYRLEATKPAVRAALAAGNTAEVRKLTSDCKPRDVVPLLRAAQALADLLPSDVAEEPENTLLETFAEIREARARACDAGGEGEA